MGKENAFCIWNCAKNCEKSSAKGKRSYDRTVRGFMLQPGDRVLVRNLTKGGRPGKLQVYWEHVVHCVVERSDNGLVYKVRQEKGLKKLRVFYRNLLCLWMNYHFLHNVKRGRQGNKTRIKPFQTPRRTTQTALMGSTLTSRYHATG